MSPIIRKINPLQRAAKVIVFAFLFLQNLSLEAQPTDEHQAKDYGLTPEQYQRCKPGLEAAQQEYYMASKSSAGASQFQATLRKAIAEVDASSKSITSNGSSLPPSFTDLFFPKESKGNSGTSDIDAVMLKPGFMGLTEKHFVAQYTLFLGAYLLNNAPEVLLPVLQERANVFPPAAADYVLYEQAMKTLSDNNYEFVGPGGSGDYPHQVPLSRSAGLLLMARAQNPVYRLLAVRAAHLVEPNETKRLNFYTNYLAESDPHIMAFAAYGVTLTNTPAAKGVLVSFQVAAQKSGNTKLADHIQKQIEGLNR